jgi:two-component system, NtrC family, nitrogen regulation sensor histidine kinase NtrY
MASEDGRSRPKRLPLSRTGRRISFESRMQLWLSLLGVPAFLLLWWLLHAQHTDPVVEGVLLTVFCGAWLLIVSLLKEQVVRPLQTLANVVAALREDDFSFRARGGRRNDALGDLALEINALANSLQGQRTGALEAMALLERVMSSMQSPVLAFDLDGRLKLLNAAGERVFGVRAAAAIGHTAAELELAPLLDLGDDEVFPVGAPDQSTRYMVNRSSFRLRGRPHQLLVLADVSAALREEERQAWERLIRVLGHEINNSLTPIKSIAGSLRQLAAHASRDKESEDFERGLEVIENRAESLNRFLQAYRQLMGMPAPTLAPVSVKALVERVGRLEVRVPVALPDTADVMVLADADQLQQALINLVRNAAEAALGPDAGGKTTPRVEITWAIVGGEASIVIRDNGPGLTNEGNLFVPFYTTKPGGTGIGLVLAKQIVEGHRGTLRLVNRASGSGCEADLRLPLA